MSTALLGTTRTKEEVEKTLAELREMEKIEVGGPSEESTTKSGNCSRCGYHLVIDTEDTYTTTVYDVDDLISDLESYRGSWFEVGSVQLEEFARVKTGEFEAYRCPGCSSPVPEDGMVLQEVESGPQCPECDLRYSDPHEALMCCSASCTAESDCYCLRGCTVDNLRYGHIGSCTCGDGCPWYVCTTCHAKYRSSTDCLTCISSHEEVENRAVDQEQTNVGGPTSLPPAMPYQEAHKDPDCAICQSEFCCSVHDQHESPHRGCLAG